MGTPIDRTKLLSIGVLKGGRTRDERVTETRDPHDGHRIKTTTTELGSRVEHNTPDDRVDAIVTPQTVHLHASEIKVA
jgi:hypothetical protein